MLGESWHSAFAWRAHRSFDEFPDHRSYRANPSLHHGQARTVADEALLETQLAMITIPVALGSVGKETARAVTERQSEEDESLSTP